jgi:hypothetical protein
MTRTGRPLPRPLDYEIGYKTSCRSEKKMLASIDRACVTRVTLKYSRPRIHAQECGLYRSVSANSNGVSPPRPAQQAEFPTGRRSAMLSSPFLAESVMACDLKPAIPRTRSFDRHKVRDAVASVRILYSFTWNSICSPTRYNSWEIGDARCRDR